MTLRLAMVPFAALLAWGAEPQNSAIRFEDATASSGIQFVHSFGARKLGSLLESTGSGCAWFDYNNDGLPDLYVASGRPLEGNIHPFPLRTPPATPPHNHLYRNDGNGKFTDVTDKAGVATDLFSTAAIAADYDNDGLEDLLVTGYGHVTLYRNKGNGTFEDATEKAGLKAPGWSIGSAWLDYDRDGCVDLFVGRYVKFDPTYRAYYAADNYPGPLDYAGQTNLLFHNNCDGTFTDVSAKSGIAAHVGRTMGATAGDFDLDGYPDIYVANDKTENFLFRNNHDGTFKEIALQAGVAFGQNGEATSAMGPVFVDLFNAGHIDLWVTDSKYNRLWRNAGPAKFKDITESAGIAQLNAQYVSWGSVRLRFRQRRTTRYLHRSWRADSSVPQEHPFSAMWEIWPVRGCFQRWRTVLRSKDGRTGRLLCRLRQRREAGSVHGEPGSTRTSCTMFRRGAITGWP
ncbi:MAG: VCBS repeat-containing protein [Bryobacteraceae bacterium]